MANDKNNDDKTVNKNQIAWTWWRVELGELHYGINTSLVHVAAVCRGYWSPESRAHHGYTE